MSFAFWYDHDEMVFFFALYFIAVVQFLKQSAFGEAFSSQMCRPFSPLFNGNVFESLFRNLSRVKEFFRALCCLICVFIIVYDDLD